MISWKVIRDDAVVFEGPIELAVLHLKQFGEKFKLKVFIKEMEIYVVDSKVEVSRSELIKQGMKRKQIEKFRKYKGFVNDPGYKFCTHCKLSKPLDAFGFRSNSEDGRARQCRECVNKKAKKYRNRRTRKEEEK
ncbi:MULTISPECIES: hypothetical protein [Bacillus]|uniref:hypothetical protein n=1 Tax=Bacillus TaxID=1386 RepID=UPI0008FB2350|nr:MULTISPECIES: hypothetical protein [Bacillus]ARC72553.1 hypothetical protein B37_00500 [Bacillus licheniformis]ARW41688.1 hypothetical protein S100141_00365 [Bacillus licheniformis]ARW56538.1 hypothetical protein S100027_04574 [Bacillus licheniformis]AXF87807.1 hypothetical protein BLDA23_05780 [Bacillus licheniformis]KAA6475767.1 hypothetical protein DX928_06595 [Bacillus swezeyi]